MFSHSPARLMDVSTTRLIVAFLRSLLRLLLASSLWALFDMRRTHVVDVRAETVLASMHPSLSAGFCTIACFAKANLVAVVVRDVVSPPLLRMFALRLGRTEDRTVFGPSVGRKSEFHPSERHGHKTPPMMGPKHRGFLRCDADGSVMGRSWIRRTR